MLLLNNYLPKSLNDLKNAIPFCCEKSDHDGVDSDIVDPDGVNSSSDTLIDVPDTRYVDFIAASRLTLTLKLFASVLSHNCQIFRLLILPLPDSISHAGRPQDVYPRPAGEQQCLYRSAVLRTLLLCWYMPIG